MMGSGGDETYYVVDQHWEDEELAEGEEGMAFYRHYQQEEE